MIQAELIKPCFHQVVWLHSVHYITPSNGYFCVSITKRCGWCHQNYSRVSL